MKKVVLDNYDDVCRAVADIYSRQLREKPHSVLGLATGGTPIGLYEELVRRYNAGEIDFSMARSFNLDEYYPISKSHPQSYDYFMRENLFDKINIARYSIPNGEADDPVAECERYDGEIAAAGGIDLMLLGIGLNGHIGFNEPSDTYPIGTYLVDLTESSLTANSRFFGPGEHQPGRALTMGIGAILSSRSIVLMICGANKAPIAKRLFEGKVYTGVPASFLLLHPDATIFLDKAAAGA